MRKPTGEEAKAVGASLAALSLQHCQISRWTDIALQIQFVNQRKLRDLEECRMRVHILSVYKHYTAGAMKVTERLIARHALTNSFWQTSQCESHPARGGTSSRSLPSWLSPDLKKKYATSDELIVKMIRITD